MQLLERIDRRLQGPAAGHVPEVGVFDFDRNRLSKYLMLLAPGPDFFRHGSDAGLDLAWSREILGERGLRAR